MPPALELRGVVKRFGAIAAVDGVSLTVGPGEVLALVGENGAGKSTLIHVACGLYRADAGTVRVLGSELPPGDPRAAIDAGLGVVFQQFMLVGPLRVWENVVLGSEPRRFGMLDAARARREVARAAGQLGLPLDLEARVEELGLGAQQRVEIVKQLFRGVRVLVLDEPTAALGPIEAGELLHTVRALAAGGRSVVFVSHKLPEVLAVADRVAVLRRGRLVHAIATSQTDALQLARAVMGAEPGEAPPEALAELGAGGGPPARPGPARSAVDGRCAPRLVARDVRCPPDGRGSALRDVSFAIRGGEIVGLAGVDGNGQSELAEVLTGLRRADGELLLDGVDGLRPGGWTRSAAAARQSGVVHVPEDRQRRGLCLPMTVEENFALGRQKDPPYARGLRIDLIGRRRKAEELIAAFDVRPPTPLARAGQLSGGNQQKLVAARELRGGSTPSLVVAVQPTRGLDLRASARGLESFRAARDTGAAVLLSSLDLDELRSLCDRLLVISGGRIAGELPPAASDEALGRLMLAHERARA